MAKSYFAILGVNSNASHAEIQTAYRRLAKEFHPDHYEGSEETFQQIQEAYTVLRDPTRRRDYEKSLTETVVPRRRGPTPYPEPEPLIPEAEPAVFEEISPVRSFHTFSPSFDEIFDWLWENFTNVDRAKSGRVQTLTLEVALTREQARRGGNARVMVPARAVCPTCRGYGGVGFYECLRCAGEGAITGEVPVSVSFPAGITKDHVVMIPLERFGISNLHLAVRFRPTDDD
jgi:DnaJ-class molecular chaperone